MNEAIDQEPRKRIMLVPYVSDDYCGVYLDPDCLVEWPGVFVEWDDSLKERCFRAAGEGCSDEFDGAYVVPELVCKTLHDMYDACGSDGDTDAMMEGTWHTLKQNYPYIGAEKIGWTAP